MKYLLIGLILLNSACSLTPKHHPARHDFGLLTLSSRSVALNKTDITVTAPAWLYNECIHYRRLYASPTELGCYGLDQWIAPPPELFKQQLLARKIITKNRLTIELSEFEQQFDSPDTARVVVHIVVNVYAPQSGQLLATQDFHLQQTTAPNAAGAVEGFAQLTQQAMNKIQHWLDKYV